MNKKWYNYFVTVDAGRAIPEGAADPNPPAAPAPERSAAQAVADIAASVSVKPQFAQTVSLANSFDEIYSAADIKAPAHGYTVNKVAEMLENAHIKDLPKEIKRSSVLVALEASGVKVQEIIEDAVKRDKALDTFETVQRRATESFESKKRDENTKAQAEVDRLLAEFRAKIQANNDAVAKEKARFETWLAAKHTEEQKIADTVGYFVSENPVTVGPVAAARPAPGSPKPEK
jgi:hypothetical protein